MSSMYKSLHDDYVSNKTRSTRCVTLALVLGCLTVLGILLAIAVLKRPPAPKDHEILPGEVGGNNVSTDQCRRTRHLRDGGENSQKCTCCVLGAPVRKMSSYIDSKTGLNSDFVEHPLSPTILHCLSVTYNGCCRDIFKNTTEVANNLTFFKNDHFSGHMFLVESIPQEMKFKDNATFGIPLEEVWKDLISMATNQVDVVSFYWTLTGEDINVNSSSDKPGREILKELEELPSRNVSVRLVTSVPGVRANSTDLKVLKQKGIQVRKVNFGRLTRGVLHSKFWIVDRKHVFLGSANMDWRALTEVKELGVVVYNCSRLAKDLHKIFRSYWVMGQSNSSLPQPWPAEYDTDINQHHPLLVKTHNVSSKIYLTGSPPPFCPPSRTQDLEAILSIISEAQHYVHVAVMEYSPVVRFEKPQRYWPFIDDAIRTAAFEKKVKIRMLISCGRDSDPAMLPFLESLASLDSPHKGVSIQIKLYIVPAGNQSNIPYTRVNHNKYMVTDKVAYIGTSNWSGDYFVTTAGVGLVISQHAPHPLWKTKDLQSQLGAVFDRDWHSEYAVHLADLGQRSDCALSR